MSALLPELPRPEQTAVSALGGGVVLGEQAQLNRARAAIPGRAQDRRKQRRASDCSPPPTWTWHGRRGACWRGCRGSDGVGWTCCWMRHDDGATAHSAGTGTPCFAVAWQHRAVPLLWRTWATDAHRQQGTAALRALRAVIQAALPADVPVVLLADRGLSSGSRWVRWLHWLRRCLTNDDPVLITFHLLPEPLAPLKLS